MKRGLTLLEVLISITIMSILVTAIGYAVSSSLKIGQENRRNQDAAEVAQAVLEQYRTHWRDDAKYAIKAVPPGVVALKAKWSSAYTVDVKPIINLNPNGTSALETDLAATPQVNPPPLRQIIVEVKEGTRIRARLETKIGNPNPQP